jgi:hypothetical protein
VYTNRWGHLNRNYSILTKIQAFALDAHFILEQVEEIHNRILLILMELQEFGAKHASLMPETGKVIP